MAAHPAFLPAFTALTVTFAFMSLALGIVPLLWLAAAVVLGYVQWRVFKASSASAPDLRPEPEAARRKRWVLLGTAVCAVALLLPWTSGVGLRHSLGGYGYDRHLVEEVDPYGRATGNRYDEWTWGWQSNPTSTPYFYKVSGRGRTGATLMVLSLMGLALLASVSRARAAVPPLVPVVLAGALTLWGLLGLSSRFGPWVFLLGVLAIDVAVLRGYLRAKGASDPRAPAGPAV
jgi:hypothetical protein